MKIIVEMFLTKALINGSYYESATKWFLLVKFFMVLVGHFILCKSVFFTLWQYRVICEHCQLCLQCSHLYM